MKLAKENGYRSRASFKLLEIQKKDHIFKQGMTVVDLGAAPGGWSQVATGFLGGAGHLIATDILPMESLQGVTFIQGDFSEDEVYSELLANTSSGCVDVVISDMAPNLSGNKSQDQGRAMYLVELALDFALKTLRPGGTFLVKVFQGEGFEAYRSEVKAHFNKLHTRKPGASRSRSREVYLLGLDFKRQ